MVFNIIFNNFGHHECAYLTSTTLTHTYTQYNINTYTIASSSSLLIRVLIFFYDCQAQAYTSFCKSHSPLADSGIYEDLEFRLIMNAGVMFTLGFLLGEGSRSVLLVAL